MSEHHQFYPQLGQVDLTPPAESSPLAETSPPAESSPLVSTGHPEVDAAVRAMVAVNRAAPVDQLPAYQVAHRTLRETLASIDEEG